MAARARLPACRAQRVAFRLDVAAPAGEGAGEGGEAGGGAAGRGTGGAGSAAGGARRAALHLFHPVQPFVLSVVQTPAQPAVLNIYFRG